MTLQELRDLVRFRLDDKVEPYLWNDDFLNGAINRAQDEAMYRIGGVADDYTPQVSVASLNTGECNIAVDASVFKVESVFYKDVKLSITTESEMDALNANWRTDTGPTPSRFIYSNYNIRIYPILDLVPPTLNAVFTMQVRRGALVRITNEQQQPDLPASLHLPLLHYVLYEAYSIPDADTNNSGVAEKHLEAFNGVFGNVPTSKYMSAWAKIPARSSILMRRM